MNPKPTSPGAHRCEKELVIENELGLHARPSALFVKTANRFKSNIFVEKEGEVINGKSIMGLMMLAAGKGTKLKIVAEGADADAAVAALEEIFRNKFNEA